VPVDAAADRVPVSASADRVPAREALLARGVERPFDLDSMLAWGRAVGAALIPPAVVALHGDLGSGKTTLARAIGEGAGVLDVDAITSPTFAILHEYPAREGTVVHADLYRLRDGAELRGLGWEEIVDRARLLIVEWPERAAGLLPRHTIHVELSHDARHPDQRLVRVKAD
jgi:tRNA threonylcarbamoyladenosine biosynthesis protein TsaE